ncbi:Maf family protein [Kushneria phosphatilytica]|uniref:7-methyl-GTP pyrophosphatase n=1 Tax=Kushneria phosphatilytica TaxID=657387 RepID=A0A1S1NRE2_9GAMM|nr:nucleoside triphosphate pyrophosphatase [Kushneria phosphatilytica]OHV11799.1 septum formation protein Maf [Kushneria phosphatilytica]QEL10964.1 septum formation inhibitor Maf [Kushneria phosphatilytica]
MPSLVLASGSRWRHQLLSNLGLPFEHASPDIDETPHPDEQPEVLAERLASSKACALRERFPAHLVIGSDQVAWFKGELLGKPHTAECARERLLRFSGQRVHFFTGLALLDTRTNQCHTHVEPFDVLFRTLSEEEICHYVARDQPFDSAGGFRMEGLGIALFERLEGRDPNALIGLPMIALCNMLRDAGLDPLTGVA